MSVNVIFSYPGEPGAVSRVEDGAVIDVPVGMSVRVELPGDDGTGAHFQSPVELASTVMDQDVSVALPDGQTILLQGYAETYVEQALGSVLAEDLTTEPTVEPGAEPDIAAQGLGKRVSIDYLGDDIAASRVDLYIDDGQTGDGDGISVDALFAALEAELGLAPSNADTAPSITGMNVVEKPLDLSDVLLETAGAPTVAVPKGSDVSGDGMIFAELATMWGNDEDGPAVNDNDVMINA